MEHTIEGIHLHCVNPQYAHGEALWESVATALEGLLPDDDFSRPEVREIIKDAGLGDDGDMQNDFNRALAESLLPRAYRDVFGKESCDLYGIPTAASDVEVRIS